jgi:hypothetical protein
MRASSLPILAHCTGSLVLPSVEERPYSENAEKAAVWGTMVHHWVQTGEINGPNKRAESALKLAIDLSGIDRLSFWPDGGAHEGGLSLRVDGLGREASRDDTPRDGWITGHFDYQWWLWGGELWVDDLKTGRLYPNPVEGYPGHVEGLGAGENRFPPRASSEQQRFYGLTLSELLGYSGPVHTSVTHWPRLPLTARHALPTRNYHCYERADLVEYWRVLEHRYQEHKYNVGVLGGNSNDLILWPGAWCKFCPADCLMRMES